MATDPVCGMTVAQHDHPHLQVDGTVWWFCSVACREEFAADPGRFVADQGPVGQAIGDEEADRLRHHAQITNLSKEHHQQADIL